MHARTASTLCAALCGGISLRHRALHQRRGDVQQQLRALSSEARRRFRSLAVDTQLFAIALMLVSDRDGMVSAASARRAATDPHVRETAARLLAEVRGTA